MLIANASKIKKSVLPSIPLFWRYFREIGLVLAERAYLLRSKNNVNFGKTCFFLRNETVCQVFLYYTTYLVRYTGKEKL